MATLCLAITIMASLALPATYADAALRRKSLPATPQTETSPRLACATLKQIAVNITAQILTREKNLNKNNGAVLQKLAAAQNKQSELITAQRANQDKFKKTTYARLEAVAKTEIQKQAATEFKDAIDRAESARRAALDKAAIVFRAGTQDILDRRKRAGESAVAELKNAIAGHARAAENNCNSGNINPVPIRATLRSNVASAQSQLINQRRVINQEAKSSLNILIRARKQAGQKAADDFKSALEKAGADFKQNFK